MLCEINVCTRAELCLPYQHHVGVAGVRRIV